MRIERGKLIFRSGRSMSANCGIVGLRPDGCICDGYDGDFDEPSDPEDRAELAQHMIEQWTKVRDEALADKPAIALNHPSPAR